MSSFNSRTLRWYLLVPLLALVPLSLAAAPQRRSPSPSSLPPTPEAAPGTCDPWFQVNANAFALPSSFDQTGQPPAVLPPTPYQGEEGFELQVFKSQLYLGMEADNTLGARLWRTRRGVRVPYRQEDWEEVIADSNGLPFGVPDLAQVDHIDSLAAFHGYLFASTANRSSPEGDTAGIRLFRSPSGNPGTWEDAIAAYGPGFGDPGNENFKDMQVFEGWLCGGTWNDETGAQVWCTQDGTTWVQKNAGGFGPAVPDPANRVIWSGAVYGGGLYFGVQNTGQDPERASDDVGELFRTASLQGTPQWEAVFQGDPGSRRVDLLGALDGFLYLAVPDLRGMMIWRSRGGTAGSWTPASLPGLDGTPGNINTVVDGAVVYNGALYVAVTNPFTGVQVWRTTGRLQNDQSLVDWARVNPDIGGDPGNLFAELASFNGHLYAWTSNYQTGQQVLQTRCPICQRKTIAGPGRYAFEAVGAALDLAAGNLESLEVCVYPGLPPRTALPALPRLYVLSPSPGSAPFKADLTLAFTGEELSASGLLRAGPLSLAHRTGSVWESCPIADQRPPSESHTVTCARVTQPGAWIIVGEGTIPPGRRNPLGWLAGFLLLSLLWGVSLILNRSHPRV